MVFLELAWLLVKAFVIFPLASLGALTIYENYLCQKREKFSPFFVREFQILFALQKILCYNKPIKRDNQEKERV